MKTLYTNTTQMSLSDFQDNFFEIKKSAFTYLTGSASTRNCDVIYKLTFNDGKVYIGQSINYFQNRIHKHLQLLNGCRSITYSGEKINNAIRTVGVASVEILYVITNDAKQQYRKEHGKLLKYKPIINAYEKYYIMLFDSVKNGYNSKIG